jgi:hypothetical protein
MKEPGLNIISFKTHHAIFKNPAFRYSVSARQIDQSMDIIAYLRFYYVYLDLAVISTVFGSTTEPSGLYGGRVFKQENSLNENHIASLEQRNIKLALTLTNHFFDSGIYDQNIPFLKGHHRQGNVIICTSDEFARALRRDFPLYKLRASIIKNLNTLQKVKKALELYDDVVIPMDMNDDDEFLENLPEKQRIMLFANATCAYNCPARVCYQGISKVNQQKTEKIRCKKEELGMLESALYFFNVEKFHEMGYSNFKLIPARLSKFSTHKTLHEK